MDVAAVAAAFAGAQSSQVQTAMAAKMMKMNASQDASIAAMIDAAAQSATKLANATAGLGQNVDISV